MKMVWVIYNQVLQAEVMELLERRGQRGFTRWQEVQGRGGETGEPHMGSFTWPSLNGVLMCTMEEEEVEGFLESLRKLDADLGDRGIQAFVNDVEQRL